ncbi:cytochrome c oxidase accessory protein CcoG [Myxococcota bacterium]|nr:cytochrome c oxidase accessory protein CcoG [Myxococcota bacterium]
MALGSRREWIYPADVKGRFVRARRVVGIVLIAFFAGMPWVTVDGSPAVLLDVGGRRVVLFGAVFTHHDTWALALVSVAAGLGLFFFTSVLGRVWCGWACPQTVWVEWLFRPIERWIEGPAHRRRKRAQGARGWDFWWRRLVKWAAFAGVTAATTFVFMSWFVGARALARGDVGGVEIAFAALLFAFFFFNGAWFREQACHYVCPYARFQGVLMDDHSLVVAYDAARGEPRRRGRHRDGGDCIDCTRCVQVCPSGIDIRDGDQLQCIACAACVDACDDVMVRIGKPRGLVRYTADRDRGRIASGPRRFLRPRAVAYLGLLGVLAALLGVGLAARAPFAVHVTRAPGERMYSALPDGRVANHFSVHVTNRSHREHAFTVRAAPGTEAKAPGTPWRVDWGSEVRMPVFVVAPPADFVAGRLATRIEVVREDGVAVGAPVHLLGPEGGGGLSALAPPEGGGPR